MDFRAPFVRAHYDRTEGIVSLETTNGQLQTVAQCSTVGPTNLQYEACPDFIATYSKTIDIGHISKWTSQTDMDKWLNKVIYSSFLSLAEQNHEDYWFVKTITTNDPTKSADIPSEYRQTFKGADRELWILLTDGIKIWPIRTVDNRFCAGWDDFWIDKTLQQGYRIIFGAEKKRIFHIVVLDENLHKVNHTSSQTSDQLNTPNIDCDYLSTACAPSTITDRNYNFQFAHLCNPATSVNQKCSLSEPLNGKPCVPILNDGSLSKFLASKRLESAVHRSNNRLKIFSGTANPSLSQEIAWYMGLDLGRIKIKRFADGEIYVQLQESVRGCDVYLVQPTCPPANENLMELLIMIDACRRASAKTITAVIPYFGYARADRKTQGRESIAAKLVANLITEAGADRVLACDLHSGQSMGYFDIPVDHVYCQPVILDYLASKTIRSNDLVVVSPDVGGVARARAFAKKLSDAPLAIVDKRRYGHNLAEVMNLIGDVKGKVAVMVDDMIDTAGTIAKGAALLHDEGAREVYACSTHAVFSPPAVERLSSGLFQEVIITNTIPVMEKNYFPQLTVLSVANLMGETIWRVHDDCSVSSIFQ